MLFRVRLPESEPAAVGANFKVSVVVAPGLSVTGNVPPASEKPVPATVPELTVTAEVPVDDNVTASVADDPTVTDPKLNDVVLKASFGLAAAVPVPVNEIVAVAPVLELLLIVSAPVAVPAVVGANLICSVNDCPTASV